MNNIMIVDDETGVRNSIKAKINWDDVGFRIIGEAANGEEALVLLETRPMPDVLMTDIRMPQMDGISLIKACKKRYPNLKLVVLSGYSDYEYMQAAIQVGVKDYLLKPVGRRELAALLRKLGNEIQEERSEEASRKVEQTQQQQQLQTTREALLLRLAKEESSSLLAVKERLAQLGLGVLLELGAKREARFLIAEMRVPANRLGDNDRHLDLLRLAFVMACRETAMPHGNLFPFYDASHPTMIHFVIVEEKASLNETGAGEEAERFAKALRNNVAQYLRLQCVIGIGEPVSDVLQFKNGYSTAMLSWSRSTVDGIDRETSAGLHDLMSLFTPELERQITLALENGDRKAFALFMQRIFQHGIHLSMFTFTFLAMRLLLLLHSVANKYDDGTGGGDLQKRLWACQMTIGNLQSSEAVIGNLEELGHLVMDEAIRARSASGGSIAAAVKKYVDDNYTFEITLNGLAELFHLNETYLSGLFKQHAGATFSDYVTRLRMGKSAELLKSTDLKLTDIAMFVGISSSSYFSTSFKKFYGVSPKEYREKHGSRGDD
ncbi:response regulator transcription factor [Paenibacillus sp. sgz302251]|uniref:response regulator transcription factor n=1 Tax=Paenibacillus sp. sgz302251 TaxID=3414493 RepID=UPI003C7C1476